MDAVIARALWRRLEMINAVTYFAPECREAPEGLGMPGFWMGYFACRAAPMGRVAAGMMEATFYNFHPARVRRAIPDAWDRAEPAAVVAVRNDAAAAALRRLLPDGDAEAVAHEALARLDAAIGAASPAGRRCSPRTRTSRAPTTPSLRCGSRRPRCANTVATGTSRC